MKYNLPYRVVHNTPYATESFYIHVPTLQMAEIILKTLLAYDRHLKFGPPQQSVEVLSDGDVWTGLEGCVEELYDKIIEDKS
jgi:hypothetical protein